MSNFVARKFLLLCLVGEYQIRGAAATEQKMTMKRQQNNTKLTTKSSKLWNIILSTSQRSAIHKNLHPTTRLSRTTNQSAADLHQSSSLVCSFHSQTNGHHQQIVRVQHRGGGLPAPTIGPAFWTRLEVRKRLFPNQLVIAKHKIVFYFFKNIM